MLAYFGLLFFVLFGINLMVFKMIKYEVGKPFPGPVSSSEGAILELWDDGPVVIIQMPGLTRNECQAFKKSFKTYGYLETDTPVPIAFWISLIPISTLLRGSKTYSPFTSSTVIFFRVLKPSASSTAL